MGWPQYLVTRETYAWLVTKCASDGKVSFVDSFKTREEAEALLKALEAKRDGTNLAHSPTARKATR